MRLGFLQRLKLRMNGRVYVGHRIRPGRSGSLPSYVFRCSKHGLVENHPAGYEGWLICPRCRENSKNGIFGEMKQAVYVVLLVLFFPLSCLLESEKDDWEI